MRVVRHLRLGAELVGADGEDLDRAGLLLGEFVLAARHVAHEGGQRGELFLAVQKFDMADTGDRGKVVAAFAGDVVLIECAAAVQFKGDGRILRRMSSLRPSRALWQKNENLPSSQVQPKFSGRRYGSPSSIMAR